MQAKPQKIKMMICEDHPLMREGLASFLETYKHVEIIGQFANGAELLDAIKKERPHVILLDIQMPVLNGAEVLRVLNENYKEIKVVIYSMFCDDEDICIYYIERGATAVVSKNKAIEELAKTVVAVLTGTSTVSDSILKALLKKDRLLHGKQPDSLTERETEILKLICKEKTDKEIADSLNVTLSTVKFHKINLLKKTGSIKSAGLFKYAIKRGLVEL